MSKFLEKKELIVQEKIKTNEIPEAGRFIFHPIKNKDYFLGKSQKVYFKSKDNWTEVININTVNDIRHISEYGKNSFLASKNIKEEKAPKQIQNDNDYRLNHTAPIKGYGTRGDDLLEAYGEDIYSSNATRYFGDKSDNLIDNISTLIMKNIRNNPNMKLTVYRAIPKEINSDINKGDWISINREYAIQHGECYIENGYKILSKEVRVCEIYTDGNSIHEWGYSPSDEKFDTSSKKLLSIDEFESKLSSKRDKRTTLEMYNFFLEKTLSANNSINKNNDNSINSELDNNAIKL